MMTEAPTPAIGTAIPLLFTYRDGLFGNGFVVEVKAVNGRALCVRESDGFWVYGVNPGAMAACADSPATAHAEFRKTFSDILKDLALEANSYEEFQTLVTQFFNDTNPGHERDWHRAVEVVRGIEIDPDIPKAPADSPRGIEVSMKKIFSAADNEARIQFKQAA